MGGGLISRQELMEDGSLGVPLAEGAAVSAVLRATGTSLIAQTAALGWTEAAENG